MAWTEQQIQEYADSPEFAGLDRTYLLEELRENPHSLPDPMYWVDGLLIGLMLSVVFTCALLLRRWSKIDKAERAESDREWQEWAQRKGIKLIARGSVD